MPEEEIETTNIRMKLASSNEGIAVEASKAPTDEKGRLVFQCPVYATQMRETITVTAENKNGTKKTMYTQSGKDVTNEGYQYSVLTYIENRLEKSTDEYLKALLRALNNYGKYAQLNFNYGLPLAEEPTEITADYTEALSHYGKEKTGECEGIELKGLSLEMNDGTNVHLSFYIKEGEPGDYEFIVNGKTVRPLWNSADSCYVISARDIPANGLQNMNEFILRKAGETSGIRYKYAALTYANAKVNSSNTKLSNLVKALYEYNVTAIDYFAHKQN
jgi:hypothetical protein